LSIFGTPSKSGGGGSSTSSFQTTTGLNTQVGDLLIVGVGWSGSGTVSNVQDTAGNTYTPLSSFVGGSGTLFQWFYCLAATVANATNKITVTLSTSNANAIVFFWDVPISGGIVGFDTDAASSGSANATTAVYSTNGTDEFVAVEAYDQSGTDSYAQGTSYTLDSAGFNSFGAAEHIVFSSAQSSITSKFNTAPGTARAFAIAFQAITIPSVASWLPTEGKHALPQPFTPGSLFIAPEKVIPYIPATPTVESSAPTTGQNAVVLNYDRGSYAAPPKFGLVTIATPTIESWKSTLGQKAVQLNYIQPENFVSPPKFGLATAPSIAYVRLAATTQFPIFPNAYIKLAVNTLQQSRNFINLAVTTTTKVLNFVNLAVQTQVQTRNYVKLAVTTYLGNKSYIKLAVATAQRQVDPHSFINLAVTTVQKLVQGPCGNIPDASFINMAVWTVNPASQNDSKQMPGQGFPSTIDWLSSSDAASAYRPTSKFTVFGSTLPSSGVSLLITAFTSNVVSFQTRTRTWLRRVDQAPSGILVNTKTNTHTLPNGTVITTTTNTTQKQDTLVTTVTIQNSGTPTRTSTIITEKTGSGQTLTREIETDTVNGIITSQEKKNVFTQPPTADNVQPLIVRTLDGVQHYQFFGTVNAEWAGGEQEGLTTINKQVEIVPGNLNGQTTDSFGNIIYDQVTVETQTDPTGKVTQTRTDEIGTRRDVGTTTTDTTSAFNALQVIVTKTINYPDGSQKVIKTTTNPLTGDSVQVTTETVTDEFGQVTTTVTTEETKIFPDPTSGVIRQTVTKTVQVTKGQVTTTDTSVDTTTDFEDDIVSNKVKVYFIQEFTITCVIDEFSMLALSEINITHQRNYALLELFGQQLGNANLSYALRQQLINQFNQANSCIAPVTLQALGRNYRVVFAQSASAFRAKLILGAEPHVYELQIIFQERSDLINGAFGG
jgi:hypothetical protein